MRSAISPCCRRAWDGKSEFPADKATVLRRFQAEDVKPTPDSPLLKLGIEKVPPIVTTAVLLDAKTHLGSGKAMEPGALRHGGGHRGDAEGAGPRQSAASHAGDVLYIYTGWGDNWKDPDTEKFYYTKGPGLSYDAAKYIEQKKVVLVALDNPFTDPVAEGFLQGQGARRPKARRMACRSRSITTTWRSPASTRSRTPTSASWPRTRSGCPAP